MEATFKNEAQRARSTFAHQNMTVRAGVGFHDKTDIICIEGKLNSQRYLGMVQGQFRKQTAQIDGINFIFQQDNVAVRTAKVAKEYFDAQKIAGLIIAFPRFEPHRKSLALSINVFRLS